MAWSRYRIWFLLMATFVIGVNIVACRGPKNRRMEAARLDSLKRDSMKALYAPDGSSRKSSMYDRERENLGNLDSLVTLKQPAVQR